MATTLRLIGAILLSILICATFVSGFLFPGLAHLSWCASLTVTALVILIAQSHDHTNRIIRAIHSLRAKPAPERPTIRGTCPKCGSPVLAMPDDVAVGCENCKAIVQLE